MIVSLSLSSCPIIFATNELELDHLGLDRLQWSVPPTQVEAAPSTPVLLKLEPTGESPGFLKQIPGSYSKVTANLGLENLYV